MCEVSDCMAQNGVPYSENCTVFVTFVWQLQAIEITELLTPCIVPKLLNC
jgi:hypothetical protein